MNNQFEKIATELEDVFLLKRFSHIDSRGEFIKTYNQAMFKELDLNFEVKESLASISKKNVLRGMHFQAYPHGCAKIVNVMKGEILDVIVGVGTKGKESSRGKVFSAILSSENKTSLFVPEGYAHGFLVLSDEAVVVYHQDALYHGTSDHGIKYDSFGFDWPIKDFVLSEKDQNLKKLEEYNP